MKQGKSLFDLTDKQKKDILHNAAVESNKAQKELIDIYDKKYEKNKFVISGLGIIGGISVNQPENTFTDITGNVLIGTQGKRTIWGRITILYEIIRWILRGK